jgi:hypothetical protein
MFQGTAPLGFRGGSTNLYERTGDQPVNGRDPSGMQDIPRYPGVQGPGPSSPNTPRIPAASITQAEELKRWKEAAGARKLLDPQPPREIPGGTIVIIGNQEFANDPLFTTYFKSYKTAFTLNDAIKTIDDAFVNNNRKAVKVVLVVEGFRANRPKSGLNQFQFGPIGDTSKALELDRQNRVSETYNIDKFKQLEGKVELLWLISCAAAADQKTNGTNVTNQLADVLKAPVRAYSQVVEVSGWKDGVGKVDPDKTEWYSYDGATDIPKK